MKKYIALGLIIVVFVLLLSIQKNQNPTLDTPGTTVTRSGRVIEINTDEIAFDGPVRITLEEGAGRQTVITVPSMGLPLCKAYQAGLIKDPYTIKTGETLSVKGVLAENQTITPCEGEDHYLR